MNSCKDDECVSSDRESVGQSKYVVAISCATEDQAVAEALIWRLYQYLELDDMYFYLPGVKILPKDRIPLLWESLEEKYLKSKFIIVIAGKSYGSRKGTDIESKIIINLIRDRAKRDSVFVWRTDNITSSPMFDETIDEYKIVPHIIQKDQELLDVYRGFRIFRKSISGKCSKLIKKKRDVFENHILLNAKRQIRVLGRPFDSYQEIESDVISAIECSKLSSSSECCKFAHYGFRSTAALLGSAVQLKRIAFCSQLLSSLAGASSPSKSDVDARFTATRIQASVLWENLNSVCNGVQHLTGGPCCESGNRRPKMDEMLQVEWLTEYLSACFRRDDHFTEFLPLVRKLGKALARLLCQFKLVKKKKEKEETIGDIFELCTLLSTALGSLLARQGLPTGETGGSLIDYLAALTETTEGRLKRQGPYEDLDL